MLEREVETGRTQELSGKRDKQEKWALGSRRDCGHLTSTTGLRVYMDRHPHIHTQVPMRDYILSYSDQDLGLENTQLGFQWRPERGREKKEGNQEMISEEESHRGQEDNHVRSSRQRYFSKASAARLQHGVTKLPASYWIGKHWTGCVGWGFPTFLMLWPFSTVPRIVLGPSH